jgi:hypothetical protein
MIVLVCGGRRFAVNNRQEGEMLNRTLNTLHRAKKITKLIHGGAKGADTHAGRWAHRNRVPVEVFYPDWDRYGKKAGHIRNGEMLEVGKPDIVVAFPGGAGTENMCQQADAAGVQVFEVVRG